MSYVEAVVAGFSNYVNFKGRAIRSEYWYFVLFTILAAGAATIIDRGLFEFAGNMGPAYVIYALATFLPGLGVSIRRLHDVGRSGWWLFLLLTVIGSIPLIYWYCSKGEAAENAYGPPIAV